MSETPIPTQIPLRRRLLAAGWTAAVALIPVVIFTIRFGFFQEMAVFLIFSVMPVVCAAMAGFWAGGPLVDPARSLTTRQAITRGVMVALLAYLLGFALLSVGFAAGSLLTGFRELTSGQNTDVARLVYELLISLLYLEILWWTSGLLAGLMLVGWLVAPLGGLAGWLLSRYYQPRRPFVFGQPKPPEDEED